MRTIYLRFIDRGAALARLSAVLGHGPGAETGELPTTGERAGTRFDVDEVGEIHAPAPEGAGEDFMLEALPGWHVNLLWWGEDESAPDFGADVVEPGAASRVFAATLPPLPSVPDRISGRQFRLQLLSMGMLDTVEAWIASQSREVQVAYEASSTVERTDAMMQMGFDALGLTGAQVDAFFTAAAGL